MTTNTNTQPKQPVVTYNNYVRNDGVIREQICLENYTRARYDEKWGYMKKFNEICLNIAKEKGISEERYKKISSKTKQCSTSNIYDWKVVPSNPIPITTSGEIGWRSSRLDCSLERVGPLYVSPKYTLDPPGVPPDPPITNIKLGRLPNILHGVFFVLDILVCYLVHIRPCFKTSSYDCAPVKKATDNNNISDIYSQRSTELSAIKLKRDSLLS